MSTHADLAPRASIATKVAQLPHLSMEALWALWDDYFDERPAHHHRGWIESRLAYRIQEQAFGGLKSTVRRRLEEIGEDGMLPPKLAREAAQLPRGTVLSRVFDDVEHRVLVRGVRDFEYEGKRFASLSAIARSITGSQWSGPAFFGLKARGRKGSA